MRDKLTTLLKVFVSLALIVVVFGRVNLAAVGAQLAAANAWVVLAALALYVLAILVNAAKWQVLLRAQRVTIPFRPLVEFQFVGFFFNNFLPANVGGDVMRGYKLARYTDRTADAAVSVVVDRVIGLLAYMSSAAAAAFILVTFTGRRDLAGVEWVAGVALAIMAGGFSILLSRRLRGLVSRLFSWRPLSALAPLWRKVSDAFNAYRFQYRALAIAFGIALVGILCTTLVNWCLSQAIGGLMSLPAILLFNPLIALVLMLPISIGGLGLNQAAYPFFYGLNGVPADHAVAVSVLMQAIIIAGSLPGGVFWLRGRKLAAPQRRFSVAQPIIAPYGSWKSPITPDLIVAGTVGLGAIRLDGADVYWTEARPTEAGRQVIALAGRTPGGRSTDLTPAPFNARTRVHEYGGGHYTVDRGTIYFSNFADQRLYRQDRGEAPRPITPEGALRYADAVVDRSRGRLICVREDHTAAGQEAVNTIASVRLDGDEAGGQVLVAGNNFYASPRLSPDGTRLAWLTWNHPNMPWDGTELWVAALQADGTLAAAERVAGGLDESIFQPEWSPDGILYFVSDRTGWWNLYRWQDGRVEPLIEMAAEFGLPQWGLGMSTYAFASAQHVVCAYTQGGAWRLALLDTRTKSLKPFDLPYTEFDDVCAGPGQALFIAASPSQPAAIIRLDLATGQVTELRRSSEVTVDSGYLSMPQSIEFPTEGGLTAHGIYYPPANRDYAASRGERPPLLVLSHGGPTGATSTSLRLGMQYWTSRGFAVLDVNYGGSTGYGRAYRERLNDRWGIVDVDDCVNGARYLVARGLADGKRLAIRGGSAGGYTTLAALTFRDVFRAGASHFGISDLEAMAKDTHKFESRYLDRLVGPYPARRDLYVARSPIHFTDRLSVPMILLQGLEDKIVPPSQAETMFAAVKAKGLPVAYLPFEGEQHGFRKAENIKRAMEAELYFYSRIFGFDLADPVEPVKIENL